MISGGFTYVCMYVTGLESAVSIDVLGDQMSSGNTTRQLLGLCGDCDGVANDLITVTGEDVSGRRNKFRLISESWRAVSPFPSP